MQYKWKQGYYHPAKMDAQVVGVRLERLEKKYGQLKPQHVVEDARSPRSPLHRVFSWDNDEAAEKWRVHQARMLIASVVAVQVIKAEDDDEEHTINVRAFVNVKGGDDRYYQGIVAAMSDDDMRNQVVARALAELVAFKRKYQDLSALAKVYEAIDSLQSELDQEIEVEEALLEPATTGKK